MVRRKISRKTPGYLKISLWIILASIIVALFILGRLYKAVFSPAVVIDDENSSVFYIYEGNTYDEVVNGLYDQKLISNKANFEWTAKKKNYMKHVKPGRYRILEGMSNNELVNLLRSGKQEAVMLSFNNIRTLDELAEKISLVLEPGADEFKSFFSDSSTPGKFGFTAESFPAMFIPNTYEFFWNTDPGKFAERMKREYVAFWNHKRSQKAKEIGMSPVEVITLASIVEQESLYDDENRRIAGVFMNRIQKGIPLQSDPTIIFALGDFSISRVLNEDKKVDSPYNTYKYRGIPPGPICIPSIAAIDAVLNYEDHNYLYFCVKPDFSGYHNFARTLSQHNKNARLYQRELNRRKIYR